MFRRLLLDFTANVPLFLLLSNNDQNVSEISSFLVTHWVEENKKI